MLLHSGSIFRTHPDTLPPDVKTQLYSRSEDADSLDAFVSHSWSSPGLPKYLALLFDSLSTHALVAANVAGGLVFGLQHWIDLPLNFVVRSEFMPLFEVTKYSSPWEYLAVIAAAATTLVFMPGCLTRQRYFLDCLCIHQTDLELKIEGIRHLGGFVAMSDSLIVMWDERYFSRLWCVYELAVFRHICPSAPVRIWPLRMSIGLLVMQAFTVVAVGIYVTLYDFVATFGLAPFYLLAGSCNLLAISGMAFMGHDMAHQLHELMRQLSTFDARAAGCFSETDRAHIYQSIDEMYGGIDHFNSNVRTKLKEYVLSELQFPQLILPYRTAVVGCSLPITTLLWYTVSFYRHEDVHAQISFAIYMLTYVFVAYPLVTSWMATRGSRLPLAAAALDPITAVRGHWRAYACIGLRGAVYIIGMWSSIALVGVLAIAKTPDGTVLGLRHSDSVWVAVAVNLPVLAAAIVWFNPRSLRCGWCLKTQAKHTWRISSVKWRAVQSWSHPDAMAVVARRRLALLDSTCGVRGAR